MAPEHYYFDTASILDLEAYGLTKRLRKVHAVIVPEVLNEIQDRNHKRRLMQTLIFQMLGVVDRAVPAVPQTFRWWTASKYTTPS